MSKRRDVHEAAEAYEAKRAEKKKSPRPPVGPHPLADITPAVLEARAEEAKEARAAERKKQGARRCGGTVERTKEFVEAILDKREAERIESMKKPKEED
jgi:hypothetical protein